MKVCSQCKKDHSRNGRYCKSCHAEYMRYWRLTNPLTEEQKIKDRARSYANVYLKRGKIEKKPCSVCGSDRSEMHHDDYSKPLNITWLCRICHENNHA